MNDFYAPPPTGVASTDTAALLPLILQAQATRGTLYLEAGTYRINTGVLVTNPALAAQPVIVGQGADKTVLEGVGGGTTLKFSGKTAETSGGYLSDLSFTGTGVGLELQNACFVTWNRIIFKGTLAIGILFHNQNAGDFTEYCAGEAHFQSGVARAVEYRRTSGDESFHGSGLTGQSTINTSVRVPATASILIGAGCIPYNSPLSVTWWVHNNDAPLIAHNGSENTNFNGIIRIETFIGSETVDVAWGNSLYLVGGFSTLSPGVNFGSLRLVDRITVAGSTLKPFSAYTEIEKARIAWTPTITGLTLGNGTISATYNQLGRRVTGNIAVRLGSTSAVTGSPLFSLPVEPRANPHFVTDGYFANGSSVIKMWGTRDGSSIRAGYINTSGAAAALGFVSPTAPFTFAAGHEIILSFAYDSVAGT